MDIGRALPVVAAVVVAGLAVYLLSYVGERLWRLARGHTATATIVRVVEESGTDDSTLYGPVVDFVTRDGQARTGVKLQDSWGRPPTIGRTVRVIYRPRNPNWAALPMWGQTVVIVASVAFVGLFVVSCAAGALR